MKIINDGVKEKDIESYLVREVRKLGGTAYKFSSPARRAVPDRLCVLPHGIIIFLECKAPGKLPTKAQNIEIGKLRKMGHMVSFVDTKETVDLVLERVKRVDNNMKGGPKYDGTK